MAYSDWTYRSDITIDNTAGSSLTGYQHKVVLTSANFDFELAESDGADIRFADGETEVKYWIEDYDSTNEMAIIWIALSIGVEEKTIQIYYGNDAVADGSDGDSVFAYFNALETSDDIADLSSSFGTSTWTAAVDEGAPNGLCTSISIGTASDVGKYKSVSLPSAYVVETLQKQTGNDGAWAGPLIEMEDSNNWSRPGTDPDATSSGVQIRTNVASSKTNYPYDVKSGCQIGLSTWYKCRTYFKPYLELSGSSDITVTNQPLQSVAWNDDDSEIVVAFDDHIGRYGTDGTEIELVASDPGGTSWGGLHIKDNKIYAVRFDGTTAAYIYSFADNDLASGPSLEATITSDMDTGANGLTFDGVNWLVGESDSSSTNIHLYVYNSSWVLQASVVLPRPGSELYGIQGLEYVDGLLYVSNHLGRNQIFAWDNITFEATLVDYYKTNINETQSMAWDPTNSRWYFADRDNHKILFRTLVPSGTDNIVFASFTTDEKSHAMAYRTPAPSFTQAYFGFGAYRSCYVTQLFVRQLVTIVPSVAVSPDAIINQGSVCWGHVSGVTEDNVRTFAGNWTGTGEVDSSGDDESLALDDGEYMESEVVYTGSETCQILQNEYDAEGDTATLKYRTGATASACQAAEWSAYSAPFASSGYVQIRVEA